jgi:hypothetical protein
MARPAKPVPAQPRPANRVPAKRRPCRRCLAAVAALVETSADGLFVWMKKKPIHSPEGSATR